MKQGDVKVCVCKKCGYPIVYLESDAHWEDHNYGYSAKIVKCAHCKADNVVKYEDDRWVKNR